MVIDADALNLLADNPELMEQLADRELVLTPHWGDSAGWQASHCRS
jgi:NAD(P)H-hydrate repair Nnr-like enzyme with NAD(P)H-hydrate dehydratase domain